LLHQKPLPAAQPLPAYTDESGKFAPGNPGKPRGARHRVTLAVESLLEGQWEALTQTALQAALRGDVTALKLCMDRIAPVRRGAVTQVDNFPVITGVADVPAAHAAIVAAVASGQITADEATPISALLAAYVNAVDAATFGQRLAELERRLAGGEKTIEHGTE
jgi:DNA-binding transcriptional regulator YdaS (Cro superfamily)